MDSAIGALSWEVTVATIIASLVCFALAWRFASRKGPAARLAGGIGIVLLVIPLWAYLDATRGYRIDGRRLLVCTSVRDIPISLEGLDTANIYETFIPIVRDGKGLGLFDYSGRISGYDGNATVYATTRVGKAIVLHTPEGLWVITPTDPEALQGELWRASR